MLYLLREARKKGKWSKRPQVAHIWTGSDTACRMYSTGGLMPKRYRVAETPEGRRLCWMCSQEREPSMDEQFRTAMEKDA